MLQRLRACLLALAFGLPCAALTQTYRCESAGRVTFQQAPCTDGRRAGSAAPQRGDNAPPAARGAALCEAHARASATFPDPDSVRIASVRLLGARPWRVHSELIAARAYGLRINARNRYGGYDGEGLFECLLSEDESRVLHFGQAAPAEAR